MIHVITTANRELYAEQLHEMHQLRRAHFVEERGWAGMTVREDGGEYDAYDDEAMVYLLALDDDGKILAAMRMRPALTGSVIGDIFPHLIAADEAPIKAPEVWEISRFFAARAARGRGGRIARSEVRLAALEIAHGLGVKRLVGMVDLEILAPLMTDSGWRVRPLGLPAPYAEGIAQGIEVQVSRGAIIDMVEVLDLRPAVALELDPARAPALPPQQIEAILSLARTDGLQTRIVVSLVRRIVALQEDVDEEQLLKMVAYVETLVGELYTSD